MAKPSSYWTCTNTTRNTILGDRIRRADTYFSRLFGLLPRKNIDPGEGLWIVPCKDIHSIGMRFAFDALYLDEHNTVVHLLENIPQMRICAYIKQARSVLELPAGTLARTHTQLGDTLVFENPDIH